MIKITRDEFSGTTTGRHYGSTWVIRFVDFGKKVHDRCARCDGNEEPCNDCEVAGAMKNGFLKRFY